jgi:hypothetical protein
MASVAKIYVRQLRDDLGRFPKWPPTQPVQLGQIGFYLGRKARFDWRTSLTNLGIDLTPSGGREEADELYATKKGVDFRFSLAAGNLGRAQFSFHKNAAVALQSFGLRFVTLPLGELETELAERIMSHAIRWNRKWVIVTGVYQTNSFTALVSGDRDGAAELATSIPVTTPAFNIADPQLGLGLSYAKRICYEVVAAAGLRPFFHVHRLVFPEGRSPHLKLYG